MNLKNRVRRLEEKANMMAKGRGRLVCSRLCKGASFDELMQMVEESLLPESGPVLKDIHDQIEEYSRRPPRKLPNGEMTQDIHGFMYWLWDLQEGNSSLPEKIPPELLLAWRNGYTNHPGGATPVPIRRCEDCLLVLPNCTPDGFGPSINPCPACGSENISHKKLSGPEPMHIYTPVNSCGGRWP
jgi:hypothetical protein